MSNQEKKPHTFTDGAGREWTIKLSMGKIDAARTATGVDVLPENNDVSTLVNLTCDHRKLGAVLWSLVEADAKEKDIDHSSFWGAMDGDALASGWEAVCSAVIEWIDALTPGTKKPLEDMIEAEMELMAAGCEQIVAALKSPQFDAAVKHTMTQLRAELQADLSARLAEFGKEK